MKDDFTEAINQARGDRAEEVGTSRLYTSFFIALVGPLALGLMWVLDYSPSPNLMYGVLATAPGGTILGIINLFRLNRFSMGAVWIFVFTVATAGLTLYLT